MVIVPQITTTDSLHVKQRKSMFDAKSTAETVGLRMAYIQETNSLFLSPAFPLLIRSCPNYKK